MKMMNLIKNGLTMRNRIVLVLVLPLIVAIMALGLLSLSAIRTSEARHVELYGQAIGAAADRTAHIAREQELADRTADTLIRRGMLLSLLLVLGTGYLGIRFQRAFYAQIDHAAESVTRMGSHAGMLSVTVSQYAAVAAEESASIAEITSTTEELSASSTQIAEHAKAVVDIAQKTWEDTKKGATSIENMILKMAEIHGDNQKSASEIVDLGRRSREISKVMEIINSIADQTKLLAFNAALEASSAGEAGKRFGVVAAEIRRLADSVTESTEEIEGKINEIQEAVNNLAIASEKSSHGIEQGMDFSSQTAALLSDIVDAAHTTMDSAKQISLSTQQQKTANSQVVIALREIMLGTTTTAASVDALSAMSRELTSAADGLESILIQLGHQGGAATQDTRP